MKFEYTFDREWEGENEAIVGEVNYKVTARMYWGHAGTRMEPPEPDEIDILKVVDTATGKEVLPDDIDTSLWEEIEEVGFEKGNEKLCEESPDDYR